MTGGEAVFLAFTSLSELLEFCLIIWANAFGVTGLVFRASFEQFGVY